MVTSLITTFGASASKTIFNDVTKKRKAAESIISPLSSKGLERVQLLESRRKTHFVDALLNSNEEGGYLFIQCH